MPPWNPMGQKSILCLIFLLMALSVSGCATSRPQPPIGRRGSLSIASCFQNGKLEVVRVDGRKNSGIQPGDTLIAFDGMPLTSASAVRKYHEQIDSNPGGSGLFEIMTRGGAHRFQEVRIDSENRFPVFSIGRALSDASTENSIAVAIVVEDIRSSFPVQEPQYSNWKLAMRASIQSRIESAVSEWARDCGSARLVERRRIDEIFEELKFQTSGAISAKDAKRLGELAGASHLLVVSLGRFPIRIWSWKSLAEVEGISDEESLRLIDVESGTILASATTIDSFIP